jgi:hypothetical protein
MCILMISVLFGIRNTPSDCEDIPAEISIRVSMDTTPASGDASLEPVLDCFVSMDSEAT